MPLNKLTEQPLFPATKHPVAHTMRFPTAYLYAY